MVVEMIVAGVVSLGIIVVARALIRGFSFARAPLYDPGKEPNVSRIPPQAEAPPPPPE